MTDKVIDKSLKQSLAPERVAQLSDDAASLEVLLRSDYSEQERRLLMRKLCEMFCERCWAVKPKGRDCECPQSTIAVLDLVLDAPGLRFECGLVGETVRMSLAKLCNCETGAKQLLSATRCVEARALVLRPHAVHEVLAVLLALLSKDEKEHVHEQIGSKVTGRKDNG